MGAEGEGVIRFPTKKRQFVAGALATIASLRRQGERLSRLAQRARMSLLGALRAMACVGRRSPAWLKQGTAQARAWILAALGAVRRALSKPLSLLRGQALRLFGLKHAL